MEVSEYEVVWVSSMYIFLYHLRNGWWRCPGEVTTFTMGHVLSGLSAQI